MLEDIKLTPAEIIEESQRIGMPVMFEGRTSILATKVADAATLKALKKILELINKTPTPVYAHSQMRTVKGYLVSSKDIEYIETLIKQLEEEI